MIFSEVSISWAILIIFSSTLCLYISAYACQKRHVKGALALAFFMLSVAFYSLGYALEITGGTSSKIIDALKFEVFWASFTAPAFFLFAIQFIQRKAVPRLVYIALFIIPVGLGVLALSNDQHSLLYKSYWVEPGLYFPVIKYTPGAAYIAQLAFLILVSLLAEILLFIHLFRCKGPARKQTLLVLIAGVLPTVSAIVNPGRETFPGLDTQPFAFAVSGLLLAAALFHLNMLDLKRVARQYAIDAIRDYMLILDKDLVIVDINKAGKKSSLLESYTIGSYLPGGKTFSSALRKSVSGYNATRQEISRPVSTIQVGDQHYQYSLDAIRDNQGDIQGYVVLINDYTRVANLLKEMENQATKDGLTDIFNRRHLISLAKRELNIARRNGSSLSVIMFDLDDFKQVNDNYGHAVGDLVLKTVAQTVQNRLRISEVFGRYGGEEFCIICPNTETREAMLIAERIRHSVEEIEWPDQAFSHITASFGVYTCSKQTSLDETIEDLLSHTDKAMYQAKSAGKNTCEVA